MNHEPECYANGMSDDPCICNPLRAAYRRGGEDAAKAVEIVIRQQLGYGKTEWIDDEDYEFIAAARGDGEQE